MKHLKILSFYIKIVIEVIYTRNKNRAELTKREHIMQLLFCLEIIHSMTIFIESVRYIKQS